MKLIGISGKRESGKSSLAGFLEVYGYKRMSLAAPLKEMCSELYGLTYEQVNGIFKEQPTQYKKSNGRFYTPREILIMEGCLKRSINPDFWCYKLKNDLDYLSDSDKVVIDDIRFLNEVQYFKKLGAKFIRLERNIGRPNLNDLSETELDDYKEWDAILIPELNRNLDDLKLFSTWIANNL